MPAAVISIAERLRAMREGAWSLLEIALPGAAPVPLGILLVDNEDRLSMRLRPSARICGS